MINPFNPARVAEAEQTKANNSVVKVDFDVFENFTDEQLRDIVNDRSRRFNWVLGGVFVVLDDYGVETKTVDVHLKDPIVDDETEEVTGWRWRSWRVQFDAASLMVMMIDNKREIVEEVYIKKADRFTGADGIFRMKDAEREYGCR